MQSPHTVRPPRVPATAINGAVISSPSGRPTSISAPSPIYRAVADEFHVPLDALPPGRRDEFINGSRRHVLAEFAASMDQAIAREFVRGIRVSSHPVRGMQIDFIEGDQPVSATVTEWWAKVQLTDEEAVEPREALEDLARRFGGDRPGPAKKNYITMFGLDPEHRKG